MAIVLAVWTFVAVFIATAVILSVILPSKEYWH